MAHETTLNGSRNGAALPGASPQAVAQNIAGVALDVFTIAELQGRLFSLAFGALCRGIGRGLAVWLISAAVLIAALPTALIGVGFWLADVTDLSTAGGLLCVVLAAVLLVVGLSLWGWREISSQGAALTHSTNELRNNMVALKEILSSYSGRESSG